MAFELDKKLFQKRLVGVQEDRIAVRTQGCWSCIHADPEKAAKLWWEKARGDLLAKGVAIATSSPLGEKDPQVLAIRQNVPLLDTQMETKVWVACRVGKNPNGEPVADFVHSTYLCGEWTGRTGASVAREGAKPDRLPEELFERFTKDGKND